MLFLLILAISITGLSACAKPEEEPKDEVEEPIDQTPDDTDDKEGEEPEDTEKTWITSIEETIEIEGKEEPIKLDYFEGDNFITYVPDDMIGEEVDYDDGEAYRFYANFSGKKNENVYLELIFYPKDLEEEPDILGEEAEPIPEENMQFDWSIKEVKSVNGGKYGILGKHNDRYFSAVKYYTVEFEEGFGPRANKIIEHIYFTDTNEYLVEQE